MTQKQYRALQAVAVIATIITAAVIVLQFLGITDPL